MRVFLTEDNAGCLQIQSVYDRATIRTVPGSIPSNVTGDFFRATSDRTMCPEVDSASDSEYQGFLLLLADDLPPRIIIRVVVSS